MFLKRIIIHFNFCRSPPDSPMLGDTQIPHRSQGPQAKAADGAVAYPHFPTLPLTPTTVTLALPPRRLHFCLSAPFLS